MLIEYARESGASQSLELQLRALSDAGCAKMFSEPQGGTSAGPLHALQRAMDFVRDGDTLVVTRLDRPASSFDIHGIIASLARSGVGFRSLQPPPLDSDRGHESLVWPSLAVQLPSLDGTSDQSVSASGQT